MEPGLRRYLTQFQEWTKAHCAPVFFRDAQTAERRNGSMTFLNTGKEILGITAGHVADGILNNWSDRPGYGCQVGSAEFHPNRLIARHSDLDLATFRLSELFLTTASHHAISAITWPPAHAVDGEKALLGGYPGILREEKSEPREYDVIFTHFGVSVNSVSDRHFGMVLNIEHSTGLAGETLDPNIDLAGCSGGGVFRVIESGLVTRLELMGIYYEGSAFGIAFAHHLSSLNPDGSFDSL